MNLRHCPHCGTTTDQGECPYCGRGTKFNAHHEVSWEDLTDDVIEEIHQEREQREWDRYLQEEE